MNIETEGKPIDHIETPRNKWLYPTDGFGKLEKNMIFESKIYHSGIKENETENFQIITVKKPVNKKRNLDYYRFINFVKKLF